MEDLPPDPYAALGVPKDATAATIKSTYRKLVLKCHPDKVTDESLKQQKQEEFHKIQQAYELIGDEEKRESYDARVKLEKLRKEKQSRSGGPDVKTARYETRTAAPGKATFATNGPPRYEERKPSRSYEEDRYYDERSSSRKYDTYEAYPKQSSSRSSRKEEPVKVSSKTADRTRSDHRRTRDREERRERSSRFPHVEDDSSSNDDKSRYEAEYRRRSDEERRRREDDDLRKVAADARRRAEDRRSYEEPKERRYPSSDDREFDRERKLSSQESDAVRYIHRSKVEADRPSPSRTNSSRDVRPDGYESRSRSSRPEPVRRSSARPTTKDRDLRKGMPEIVEWSEPADRKPPSFKHSSSSPADLHVPPRGAPQRSYTEAPSSRDTRRTETSPTPIFRRSETMPSVPHRRKEATVTRPSGLRSSESASPPEPEPAYVAVPPPQSSASKKYYYPTPGGGVSLHPADVGVANGHRTVLHEPDRRTRSPSPLSRPPIGPNRHVGGSSVKYQPAAPAPPRTTSATIPPPLSRSSTFNATPAYPEERGRSGRLYGEVPKRENDRRQTSYSPDSINYARKIGPEDIRWSGRDEIRSKPTLGRHPTYVF